jgi:Bacteriophytochrome (light-regulated signal transduction histidine kinase)
LKSTTDQKQKLFEIFRDNELELHKLRLEHANSDFALAKQQILFYFACLIILFLVILAIYWYRNNTKQKGQNKQLTFLNDELSEKMRLVNNQKQQLEDVNNKLEDANQNLENFAAITAHDLRSPLANIYRLNEYVFSKYAHLMSSKDNETCGFVQDNTKRLMKLIEDILSFTNIKEQQVQFSELNIGDAIILAKHNLTLEINEKKVLIEYPKVMPNVMADFNLMVVLFQNLLHNAIKFVKPDQVPHISITSKINKRFVHIRVMDNGIGIPREKMKTVFTLFEKANANRFPGSGVGLSSCKKIVQYFNGRIWIESVEGHGTIVNLEFPIMQSTPKHVEPVEESSLS